MSCPLHQTRRTAFWKASALMMLGLCSACSKPAATEPTNYDDCILQKVSKGQTKAAALAVIAACRSKFPEPNEFADLIPSGRAQAAAIAAGSAQAAADRAAAAADAAASVAAYGHAPSDLEDYREAKLNAKGQSLFHDVLCTDDCSGHEAGYAWAEENGITDPENCGGKSPSFIEGCQLWASENR